MLSKEPAAVTIGLELSLGDRGDERELDELTRLLGAEIRDLDVESVELSGQEAASVEAKGVSVAVLAGLVIKLVGGEAFKNVLAAAQAWASRNAGRSVKMTLGGDSIEVANITPQQQERLIETFQQRVVAARSTQGDG